jgi:hypothetical protein
VIGEGVFSDMMVSHNPIVSKLLVRVRSASLAVFGLVGTFTSKLAYKRQVAHQHSKQKYSFHIFSVYNHTLERRKPACQSNISNSYLSPIMASFKPYNINISASRLERLMQKLALADFPNQDDLEDDSWTKGPPVREIKRLVDVWQTVYNWRDVEARLNQLPQFLMSIDIADFGALDIHFVHKKSTKADAIPLLFLHGWPGSFYEVSRIINPLVQGDDKTGPTFHVVAPSLVDFGFSSPSKASLSILSIGIILTSVLTIQRWDLASSTTRRYMTSSCAILAITTTV